MELWIRIWVEWQLKQTERLSFEQVIEQYRIFLERNATPISEQIDAIISLRCYDEEWNFDEERTRELQEKRLEEISPNLTLEKVKSLL